MPVFALGHTVHQPMKGFEMSRMIRTVRAEPCYCEPPNDIHDLGLGSIWECDCGAWWKMSVQSGPESAYGRWWRKLGDAEREDERKSVSGIPEHLLQRSRDRRAALGLGRDYDAEDEFVERQLAQRQRMGD
jgi:hypothetical protein